MACEECARLVGAGRRNLDLRRQMKSLQHSADDTFRALCNDRAAAAMAALWDSGHFDCGPDNYEFIVEKCLTVLAQQKNASVNAPSLCQQDIDSQFSDLQTFYADRDFGDESGHVTD